MARQKCGSQLGSYQVLAAFRELSKSYFRLASGKALCNWLKDKHAFI